MDHPVVEKLEREGLPEADIYGMDSLGNEVFVGDEIYWFDEDHYYLKETLSGDAEEILQQLRIPVLEVRGSNH